VIQNPTWRDRFADRLRRTVIGMLAPRRKAYALST
jgi:hypothetical protein